MPLTRTQVCVSAGLWLFFAFFWGVLITIYVGDDQARLRRQTTHTVGRVVDKQPANHRLLRYEYVVDGVARTGTAFIEQPLQPRYEDYGVGDAVAVAYEPSKPENSCACDPEQAAQGALAHPVLWAIFAATASTGLLQFVVWPHALTGALKLVNSAGPPN